MEVKGLYVAIAIVLILVGMYVIIEQQKVIFKLKKGDNNVEENFVVNKIKNIGKIMTEDPDLQAGKDSDL
jgi:hypothetical protein